MPTLRRNLTAEPATVAKTVLVAMVRPRAVMVMGIMVEHLAPVVVTLVVVVVITIVVDKIIAMQETIVAVEVMMATGIGMRLRAKASRPRTSPTRRRSVVPALAAMATRILATILAITPTTSPTVDLAPRRLAIVTPLRLLSGTPVTARP